MFVVFGAIQLGYTATVIESQSKERRGSLEIMRRARVAETDTRKFNQVVFVCRHGPPSRSYFETATIDNGYSVGDNVGVPETNEVHATKYPTNYQFSRARDESGTNC